MSLLLTNTQSLTLSYLGSPLRPGTILAHFLLDSLLGRGSFAKVYSATNTQTSARVALKVQMRKSGTTDQCLHEHNIYKLINRHGPSKGMISTKHYEISDTSSALAMPLLGYSLQEVRRMQDRFSLKATLKVGLQILQRLRVAHKAGVVHVDLKPDNVLLERGVGEGEQRFTGEECLYLVDFGLAREFRDAKGAHVMWQERGAFIGNTPFAARAMHRGETPSRRNDMESLAYLIVHLFHGALPWTNAAAWRSLQVGTDGDVWDDVEVEPCSELDEETVIAIEDYNSQFTSYSDAVAISLPSVTERFEDSISHVGRLRRLNLDDISSVEEIDSMMTRSFISRTYSLKRAYSGEKLCVNMPDEVGIFVESVRNLGFSEKPDYDYLKGLLEKAIENLEEVQPM